MALIIPVFAGQLCAAIELDLATVTGKAIVVVKFSDAIRCLITRSAELDRSPREHYNGGFQWRLLGSLMNTTSASLLCRLTSDGDQDAWNRFVDLYAPLIFYWSRKQGLNVTDSADLVQDVMAILVVKLPVFDYNPSLRFRGWLRTVTHNKANDIRRRNLLRPVSRNDEQTKNEQTVSSEIDLFEQNEYRTFLVKRALEIMKAEFHDQSWKACWKHVVDGMKAADIALELGMSVNMVYLAKSRVLARLREELTGMLD